MASVVYIGSKTPIVVSVTNLPGEKKMKDVEFTSKFFVSGQMDGTCVTMTKSDMIQVNESLYLAYVNTVGFDAGELRVRTDVSYQHNGIDITEVLVASTGVTLRYVS